MPAERTTARWADGIEAAAWSVLRAGETGSLKAWAIGTLTPFVRKLRMHRGRKLRLGLPAALVPPLGWSGDTYVALLPLPPNESPARQQKFLRAASELLACGRPAMLVLEVSELEISRILQATAGVELSSGGPRARER